MATIKLTDTIKKLENYFENVTPEQFDKDLIAAGIDFYPKEDFTVNEFHVVLSAEVPVAFAHNDYAEIDFDVAANDNIYDFKVAA